MDELDVRAGLSASQGHPERVEDEVGTHVVRELPADDHPAVDVDHEREEDRAFPAAEVGEIDAPELVGPGRLEVALDEVRRPARVTVWDGRPPRFPASFRALDLVSAHQPLHPAAADLLTRPSERLPHPPGAIREVVAPVDLSDQLEQPLVLNSTS